MSERDIRKEWEKFLEDGRRAEANLAELIEYCQKLGREVAERKNAAVLAALEKQ